MSKHFLESTSATAPFGVITGHGREDICYFNKFAICGQHTALENKPCNPCDCPYDLPKVHGDTFAARILVILSCSAGKIGSGLLPSNCRIHLSCQTEHVDAIIAPVGLFTITVNLVEYVTKLLLEQKTVGEIAHAAENAQKILTGENVTFAVFGDPNISAELTSNRKSPRALIKPTDKIALEALRSKISHLADQAENLSSLSINDGTVDKFLNAQRSGAKSIGRLLKKAHTEPKCGEILSALVKDMTQTGDRIDETVVACIIEKTRRQFFWLSHHYDWYVFKRETFNRCYICASAASIRTFVHPFRTTDVRHRTTCERCGVTEDRAGNQPISTRVEISILRGSAATEVRLALKTTKPIAQSFVDVGINNSKQLHYTASAILGPREIALPARFTLEDEFHIRLILSNPVNGCYFVKICLAASMQLNILSIPIALGPKINT